MSSPLLVGGVALVVGVIVARFSLWLIDEVELFDERAHPALAAIEYAAYIILFWFGAAVAVSGFVTLSSPFFCITCK